LANRDFRQHIGARPWRSRFARHALQLIGREVRGVCFEITETAVIDNPTAALENIDLFAANGVRISIDDYGSVYPRSRT